MAASITGDATTDHTRWTSVAHTYQQLIGKCTMHGTSRLVDIINEISPFTKDSNVVDVAAGAGSLTIVVHEKSPEARVLATDIAEGMLVQIDKRGLANVSTQREDAVTLAGLQDNSFTHGMSTFAIQFTPDMAACVRSLHRVIRPGGIVGIAIWGPYIGPGEVHNEACRNLQPDYVPVPPEVKGAWRGEEEHRRQMEESGFENVRTEIVRMPFEPGSAKGACDYWFRGGNPVPEKMVRDWMTSGGSVEELEREYQRLVREKYGNGKDIYFDGLLGWGTKPR
jgi:ubiquinone/menaquinone biosynthesis C-methylase UbiE